MLTLVAGTPTVARLANNKNPMTGLATLIRGGASGAATRLALAPTDIFSL